jgi:hypothetical protein
MRRRARCIRATGQGINSNTCPHVGHREGVALEQQGRVHGRGKRVGGAIREIEPRLGMNAFAVAAKGDGGGAHLRLVDWDNFNFAVRQQLPETLNRLRAVAHTRRSDSGSPAVRQLLREIDRVASAAPARRPRRARFEGLPDPRQRGFALRQAAWRAPQFLETDQSSGQSSTTQGKSLENTRRLHRVTSPPFAPGRRAPRSMVRAAARRCILDHPRAPEGTAFTKTSGRALIGAFIGSEISQIESKAAGTLGLCRDHRTSVEASFCLSLRHSRRSNNQDCCLP